MRMRLGPARSGSSARRFAARPRQNWGRHIPDIIRNRAIRRDEQRKIDEIAPTAGRSGRRGPASANKFHGMVAKMRQALTFLATFENDLWNHENAGRDLDSGAAHHVGGRLYRPTADRRSAWGAARELTRPWGQASGTGWGERCFRWIRFSGSSACRPYFWLSASRHRFRAAEGRAGSAPDNTDHDRWSANRPETAGGNMVTSFQLGGQP
jgi:hypothetical protein